MNKIRYYFQGRKSIETKEYSIAQIEIGLAKQCDIWDLELLGRCSSSGIEDKNSAEIFKGDIVRHEDFNEPCEVTFERGCFRIHGFTIANFEAIHHMDKIEIVGNIYQSPELLGIEYMNKQIHKLSSENWHGESVTKDLESMRKQLYTNLSSQIQGYWSGSTAYHIMTSGVFLIDAESGIKKKLTKFGELFINDYQNNLEVIHTQRIVNLHHDFTNPSKHGTLNIYSNNLVSIVYDNDFKVDINFDKRLTLEEIFSDLLSISYCIATE